MSRADPADPDSTSRNNARLCSTPVTCRSFTSARGKPNCSGCNRLLTAHLYACWLIIRCQKMRRRQDLDTRILHQRIEARADDVVRVGPDVPARKPAYHGDGEADPREEPGEHPAPPFLGRFFLGPLRPLRGFFLFGSGAFFRCFLVGGVLGRFCCRSCRHLRALEVHRLAGSAGRCGDRGALARRVRDFGGRHGQVFIRRFAAGFGLIGCVAWAAHSACTSRANRARMQGLPPREAS